MNIYKKFPDEIFLFFFPEWPIAIFRVCQNRLHIFSLFFLFQEKYRRWWKIPVGIFLKIRSPFSFNVFLEWEMWWRNIFAHTSSRSITCFFLFKKEEIYADIIWLCFVDFSCSVPIRYPSQVFLFFIFISFFFSASPTRFVVRFSRWPAISGNERIVKNQTKPKKSPPKSANRTWLRSSQWRLTRKSIHRCRTIFQIW